MCWILAAATFRLPVVYRIDLTVRLLLPARTSQEKLWSRTETNTQIVSL